MVDIHQLFPGQKVKIVDQWCFGCNQARSGHMDKYLGAIMTVRSVDCLEGCARMVEDEDDQYFFGGWYWFPAAIEYVVEVDDGCDTYDETINSIDDFMKQFAVKV